MLLELNDEMVSLIVNSDAYHGAFNSFFNSLLDDKKLDWDGFNVTRNTFFTDQRKLVDKVFRDRGVPFINSVLASADGEVGRFDLGKTVEKFYKIVLDSLDSDTIIWSQKDDNGVYLDYLHELCALIIGATQPYINKMDGMLSSALETFGVKEQVVGTVDEIVAKSFLNNGKHSYAKWFKFFRMKGEWDFFYITSILLDEHPELFGKYAQELPTFDDGYVVVKPNLVSKLHDKIPGFQPKDLYSDLNIRITVLSIVLRTVLPKESSEAVIKQFVTALQGGVDVVVEDFFDAYLEYLIFMDNEIEYSDMESLEGSFGVRFLSREGEYVGEA